MDCSISRETKRKRSLFKPNFRIYWATKTLLNSSTVKTVPDIQTKKSTHIQAKAGPKLPYKHRQPGLICSTGVITSLAVISRSYQRNSAKTTLPSLSRSKGQCWTMWLTQSSRKCGLNRIRRKSSTRRFCEWFANTTWGSCQCLPS